MKMKHQKKTLQENPIENANCLSFATFWWLNNFFAYGYKHYLEEHDMYKVTLNDSSVEICQSMERAWKMELEYCQVHRKKPSLLRAVIKNFFMRWAMLGSFGFIEESLRVLNPIFIGCLLRYFEGKEETRYAYCYATGIFSILVLLTVIHHIYYYMLLRIGWHLRAGMCALIYKKTLRLSQKSLSNTTTGQIVNLGATDVMRFDLVTLFLHYLWLGPLQAIVITYLLWKNLGPSSLAGLAIVIVAMIGQSLVGRKFGRIRAKMAVLTDERIRIMNEVISSMRIIKMYTWEESFQKLIDQIRRKEIKKVLSSSILKGCNFSMVFFSPKLLGFATFTIYVCYGGHLTPSKVFSALALYNVIRVSMGLFFPLAIEKLSESLISLKRIETFLLLDEIVMDNTHNLIPKSHSDCNIEMNHFTASWTDEESSKVTLHDLTLKVELGKLLAVIGPVGSGKTSFLCSILRELQPSQGHVNVLGQVVYVPQIPWVFSGTVRENILFGEDYDESRYNSVLKSCVLNKDINSFECGDLTLVGERGVTLSGGQKARINLARAAYRLHNNNAIVLLDDPLSAVDAAVAMKLFKDCICGYMKGKIRILVTHQLQFLKDADQVMILKDGCISGLGSFSELQAEGTDFAALLKKDDTEAKETPLQSLVLNDNLIHLNRLDEDLFASQSLISTENLNMMSLSSTDVQLNEEDSYLPVRSYSMHDSRLKKKVKKRRHLKNDLLPPNESSKTLLEEKFKAEFVAPVKEEELRAQGNVGRDVYLDYFRASPILLIVLILLSMFNHITFVLCDWWMSVWATNSEVFYSNLPFNQNNISNNSIVVVATAMFENSSLNSSAFDNIVFDNYYYIIIYAILTAVFGVFLFLRVILQFYQCVWSGVRLHNDMFHAILHAPIRFFDVNPVGRILNRFSKDMGQIDEMLPLTFMDFIFTPRDDNQIVKLIANERKLKFPLSVLKTNLNSQRDVFEVILQKIFFLIVSILIVAVIINWFVGIIVIPLLIYFFWLRQYYMKTSRDIKRMEGSSRSPVFTLLSSTLQGLTTVRAFNMEEKFEEDFHSRQDLHSSAWFLFLTGSRWFALRLDAICTIFIACFTYFSVVTSALTDVNAGQVGLALTYCITLIGMFQWGTRQSTEVENLMTSVERVQQYSKIPPEPPHEKKESKPPSDWPQYGIITFENLSYAHSADTPNVLHKIRLNIRAHEKVGIVGRTGAGKSSLISTLFRFNEFTEGEVYIDGIATSQLGLTDLRSAISIIPQDPILFADTMRKNLDTFSDYSDDDLWNALEQVQLKPLIESLPLKLDSMVAESGSNFSVGQRQLLCLARAILRQNRILVIDEATANVDVRTDRLVQETIRRNFKHCTVLTIAHRLNTIIDCDRVMVLEEGRVVEFDVPHLLLQMKDGKFTEMVESTGKSEAIHLKELALKNYEELQKPTSDVEDSKRSYLARYLPTPGSYSRLELETNV